jgi:hypothetical protein
VGAAALAGGTIVAGVSAASVPDSGGVIHGCYNAKLTTVRVIDPALGQSCQTRLGEAPLDWNQQGPPGATGPQGPPGAAAGVKSTDFQDRAVSLLIEPGERSFTIECLDGYVAVSGGFRTSGAASPVRVVTSMPANNYSTAQGAWTVVAVNTHPTDAQQFAAYAICQKVQS